MAASNQASNKIPSKTNSKDLMNFPLTNSSLRSKLVLFGKTEKPTGPLKTFKIDKSSVLGRVQTFMPLMAEADQKLKEDLQNLPSGSLDIENVGDGQEHVEMSLALVPDSYDDLSSESSLSEEESENEEIKTEYIENGSVTETNLKLPIKPDKKPVIQLLKSDDNLENYSKKHDDS